MIHFLKRLVGKGKQKKEFFYGPPMNGVRKVRSYKLGTYRADLLTDIQSNGSVDYEHVFAVFRESGRPAYFVTSELNPSSAKEDGSHRLGIFDPDGHRNLNASDNWADLETFEAEAIKMTKRHFNIQQKAELMQASKPTHPIPPRVERHISVASV